MDAHFSIKQNVVVNANISEEQSLMVTICFEQLGLDILCPVGKCLLANSTWYSWAGPSYKNNEGFFFSMRRQCC